METHHIGNLLSQLAQILIFKPSGCIIQRKDAAKAGKVVRVLKQLKQPVQIAISQTVRINENVYVIRQKCEHLQLIQIIAVRFRKEPYIIELRRIFVFLIRQNRKRNRRFGKPAVRVQQIHRHFVVLCIARGDGDKTLGHNCFYLPILKYLELWRICLKPTFTQFSF